MCFSVARVILEDGEFEALVEENDELKEALRRQTTVQSADKVSQSELEFTVFINSIVLETRKRRSFAIKILS